MSKRVLLVEDDPTARFILSERLSDSGYEVSQAEDGLQALEILNNDDVALVVSDWMMPEMDGIELCRRIKNDPRLDHCYFIIMSARDEEAGWTQGLAAGADDYLSKPVSEQEMLARLRVGERVLAQQRSLQELATTDPLTGLRNRRSFEDDLESELATAKRYAYPFSMLLIDLDNFKKVNDTRGHTRGDEALRLFGEFLSWTLRRSDHMYRIGGDEFAVLLPRAQEAEARMTADRLKSIFKTYKKEHHEELPSFLSFSIGSTSIYPGADLSKEELLRNADRRMLQDKKRAAKSGGQHSKKNAAPKGTILVVDDEPVTRKILQHGLASFGYTVLVAEDGESCLDLMRSERPHVLLLDWMMPGIDGMEVCRTIRSDGCTNTPYIIMVTVVGGSSSRVQALDGGADDYVNKPIDMDELLAKVRVGMRIEEMKAQIASAEKLKGVIQMAGAAAHELSQPLTALMGLADYILMQMEPNNPHCERLQLIVNEVQRLGNITKKMGRIMKYETRDYFGNTKIVDIDKASQGDESGERPA